MTVSMTISGYTSGDPQKVDVPGDSMTGALVLSGAPTLPLHAATKAYVDNASTGSSAYADTAASNAASLRVAKTGDTMTGNLVITTSGGGRITFGDNGTNDVVLYRSAADVLKTDDALHVVVGVGINTAPSTTVRVGVGQDQDVAAIYITNTAVSGNTNQALVRGESATSTSLYLASGVTGDSVRRFVTRVDGQMTWGDGSAGRDTNLYRNAADQLKTDDSLVVGTRMTVGTALNAAQLYSLSNGSIEAGKFAASADGTATVGVLVVNPSSTSKRAFDIRLAADTVSRLRVDMSASGSGTLVFGDGTTADTNLYRSAADTLKTDDAFVANTLQSTGAATVGAGLSVTDRMLLAGFYVPATPAKARMPQYRSASYTENFQTGHGYSATGTGVSSNLNYTSDFVRGTQCASITTSGAGDAANIRKTSIGTTLDLTNKAIRLTFKISDVTKLSLLQLYVGNTSFTNFLKWDLHSHSAVNPNIVQSGEWVTITCHWSNITSASGTYSISAGLPSSTTGFTDIQFRVTDNATGAVTLYLQSIEVIPDTFVTFPNGVISVTFDDSYVTQYSLARPKMDALGYRGTVYTIADVIDSNHSVYMNLSELKALQQNNGWEVAGHAYTGSAHGQTNGYADSTAQQVRDEFTKLKLWMVKNGFTSDNFAYPKGHFDNTSDGVAVDKIASEFWSTSRTIISETTEMFPPTMAQRVRAKTGISGAAGGTSVTTMTSSGGMLDRTKGSGDWLILCLHKLTTGTAADTTELNQTEFNTLMDAIASRSIPVLPVNEVIRYYA